jgi:hypothetical protein
MNTICQVTFKGCFSEDVPCAYFDPPDHLAATHIIEERLRVGLKRWKLEKP